MVSETRGGFAPTGWCEVGISPRALRGGGCARKVVHDSEASASSSDDSTNSCHGSFGSDPSSYGSSTTRTSSFYGLFSVRKLEMIRRWRRPEEERRLGFGVRGRVTGRGLYRGKPSVYG
jgi:hypothetical protein